MNFEKWIKRRYMILIACVLLFVLMIYLCFSSYRVYILNSNEYKADVIDAIGDRLNILFLEINDFPRDEGDDVLYLSRLKNLRRLVNSNYVDKDEIRADLEGDFLTFLEINDVYYQVRYIDDKGDEIVRVDYDGEKYFVVNRSELQNKRDRYYFNEALKLSENEVYVSRLDLNIENGVLENRGSVDDPLYVPVIRYAVPVFDEAGNRKGMVVLNVYADYFLEDIRRMGRGDDISFLVDNNGYYLAHPNRSKEFSFMFDGKDSMTEDYPDVSDNILTGFDMRNIENDDYIFTFRHLYPTIGTFEVYSGSKRLFGDISEREYYWVLVSVVDKDVIEGSISSLKSRLIVFLFFSGLIIAFIFLLLLIILVINGKFRK